MLRRARLLEVLDGSAETSLTMLNAGAGYGKTTLARTWCVQRPEAVVWITLDGADDDPMRLWGHLATGVERLSKGFRRSALSCLATRGASVETAIDELMNGLVKYGRPATIVLDDLHAVRSERSLHSIRHAIARLPENVRLLGATRVEPAIGLARLRAKRGLAEVRARELAFTVEEASELFVHEGIELSAESVESLVQRTEGWPAGLYLAALWLRDLDNPDAQVLAFAGSARQIGDYLTDEVLAAIGPQTRDFLARTSVLGRFTAELCDAVLDRDDSAAVLAELVRPNMFLVALDAPGRAAATALLARPEIEVAQLLGVAERARRERPHLWSPYLEAGVELVRAEMIEAGDVGAAVEHGRRAVSAARAGAEVLSVSALATLAQALFFAGDLDDCRRVLEQAIQRADAPEVTDAYVASLGLLALIDAERGRPESAESWARQAIDYARQRFQSDSWVASMPHLGLAQACALTGRLDEAEREALRGERLRRSPQPTIGHAHALLVLSQIRVARSRLSPAVSDLRRAQRMIAEFPDPGRLATLAVIVEQNLAAARANADAHDLIEQPSPAELAVLQGLADGLSRREIGQHLSTSAASASTES